MARFRTALAAAALAVLPATSLAQDKPDDGAVGYISNGLFDTEPPPPLTAEEQARLPLATALAEKVIPPGSLDEMMDAMMGGLFRAVTGSEGEPSARDAVNRRIATYGIGAELTDAQATRIADLLDPAWRERETRSRALAEQVMGRVMQGVEPVVRQAMAELYAIYFSEAQLADIDAFFATPSGAAYARQSYQMASDPRLTATMMRTMMPATMDQLGSIQAEIEAATADLPPQRTYADLTTNQRKLLAQWLGLSAEELEYALIDANGAFPLE